MGVDNFYGNDDQANGVLAKAKVEGIPICVLNADGTIPWPDAYFDVILSNQVMEHVFDLDFVCGEMYRVLKRNGVMLHVFPTRERIMEGHIGVPIVHWFPKKHRFNELLILVARRFGFGFGFKIKEKPDKKWAHDVLEWLDRHVFYRNWQ